LSTARILLADDHALMRAGIRSLLEECAGLEVVGEAADGYEALQLMRELRPDVALVDISMPGLNGLETAARAQKESPRTRVLLLSMHKDEEYVRRALLSGAAGYLLKDADRTELELAVRAVARGDTWLSPGISRVVAAFARGEGAPRGPLELLTRRQREGAAARRRGPLHQGDRAPAGAQRQDRRHPPRPADGAAGRSRGAGAGALCAAGRHGARRIVIAPSRLRVRPCRTRLQG